MNKRSIYPVGLFLPKTIKNKATVSKTSLLPLLSIESKGDLEVTSSAGEVVSSQKLAASRL